MKLLSGIDWSRWKDFHKWGPHSLSVRDLENSDVELLQCRIISKTNGLIELCLLFFSGEHRCCVGMDKANEVCRGFPKDALEHRGAESCTLFCMGHGLEWSNRHRCFPACSFHTFRLNPQSHTKSIHQKKLDVRICLLLQGIGRPVSTPLLVMSWVSGNKNSIWS